LLVGFLGLLFDPEDEGSTLPRNPDDLLPDCKASLPRRPYTQLPLLALFSTPWAAHFTTPYFIEK
jgi:hypothetical protein